jgi:CubicO group peptidase (beta-lactamase class C family)
MDSAPFPEIKEAYAKADIESRETDLSPEEFLKRLGGIPLAWQPGSRWEYGLSDDVLGVLLERLTTKRLDILLEEMIFKPLKMAGQRDRIAAIRLHAVARLPRAHPR